VSVVVPSSVVDAVVVASVVGGDVVVGTVVVVPGWAVDVETASVEPPDDPVPGSVDVPSSPHPAAHANTPAIFNQRRFNMPIPQPTKLTEPSATRTLPTRRRTLTSAPTRARSYLRRELRLDVDVQTDAARRITPW